MSYGVCKVADEIRVLAAADVLATWAPLVNSTPSPSPSLFPLRQLFIQNLTDQTVVFNYADYPMVPPAGPNPLGVEGTNSYVQMVLPAFGFFLDDVSTNRNGPENELMWPKNLTLYCAQLPGGAAPTTGAVYASYFYARGD